MRNFLISVTAIAALAACAPSGKQVAMAKQARFTGDKIALFNAAKSATESKYKIAKIDEAALGLQTVGRWYNPEGQAVSSNMDDVRDVPDKSLNIALIVEVLPEGSNYVVAVKPMIMRYIKGRPNPDIVDAKDPSLPGWAHGKVDNLQVEIYNALKQYEVKAGAPGPAAPAPTPATTTQAPPPGAELPPCKDVQIGGSEPVSCRPIVVPAPTP